MLGPDTACAFCGESRRETLERHHVGGRANEPDQTVVLCRNCHACVTEGQLRLGADLRHDKRRTLPEREEAALLSEAAFDQERAKARQRRARKQAAFKAKLDQACPDWHDWPEAQA